MLESRRLPLWAGRTAALLGIVLVAFTLRQAVAAVSPLIGDIRADFLVSNLDVGLLGTLPPLLFAASGFTAPRAHGVSGSTAGSSSRWSSSPSATSSAPSHRESRCCSSAASWRSPAPVSATCCCRPSSVATSPTGWPC
jgi:hypothetical protein